MNESKKALVITIIAILVLAGIIYFVQHQKSKFSPQKGSGVTLETPGQTGIAAPSATPKEVGAGETGETEETLNGDEVVVLPAEPGGPPQVLPPAIFNESGTIKEIKENSLIIAGTGYNFPDQKPRDLTLKFMAATRTSSADRTKFWTGLEGLKQIKVGDKITFESPENIRGKTEFEVSYINKL